MRHLLQTAVYTVHVNIHVLPLLLQIAPEIPVLYEHNGAGCHTAAARAPYSWCILGPFVLMLHKTGRPYCATDLNVLLHHTLNAAA